MSQSDFLSVGGGVTGLNGSRRISGEGGGLLRFVRFPGGSWPRFRCAVLSSDKCDRPTRQFEVRENRQRHRDELRVKAGGAAGKAKSNFGKTMGPLSGGGANAIDHHLSVRSTTPSSSSSLLHLHDFHIWGKKQNEA